MYKVITTIGIVNIHHHLYLPQFFFFPVLGTFRIYSLNKVQMYNTVLLIQTPCCAYIPITYLN